MSAILNHMPIIGFGTFQIKSDDIFNCLDVALEAGYRFFDTAQCYGNEAAIGDALKKLLPKYLLKREDIFITTKVAPANQGEIKCRKSVLKSLEKLDTQYIDLVLIHWPGTAHLPSSNASNSKNRSGTWKILEQMVEEKVIKWIGVSNYNINHLEELLLECKIKPALNQCEYHPFYYSIELVEFCKKNGIHFQAYSSFGSASHKNLVLEDADIVNMAKEKNCTTNQLVLAWSICQGISVLPRSKSREHIISNFGSAQIVLSDKDIQLLVKSNLQKFCWDPKLVV
uniref:Aldo_ket_red domain-containing protein n=1 Tax=Rhabditophanes sp. KR3021 TaxID=114890 RepID=A0AC35TRL5_9BILA